MHPPKLTSFEIDSKTASALESLKKVYGVGSNAAVIRRALAIALIASKHADEDHTIHIIRRDPGEQSQEVLVPQRL
jgi:hypothetical protein